MKSKYLLLGVVIVLTILFAFSNSSASSSPQTSDPLPTQGNQPEVSDQIKQAVLEAVAVNDKYKQGKMVTSLQVTDISASIDQLWGTAWVVYYDGQIEALIPTEPALAVTQFVNDQWKVFLPSDNGWQTAISSVPEDLLSQDEKDMWSTMNQGGLESYPTQSGYYLPWHGGETARLSRSVGHDADYSTSHYAFDFYKPGDTVCPSGGGSTPEGGGINGLNFSIYASKAGTVWSWNDSVEDCDHSAVNFIVLRNVDDPTIFQLYMHLAQNSIPPALKTVGAPVARGQFLALVDNTGASSGSHLHFQVEHQPYWPADNPYWNTSLDMTFEDVNINGGRPRVSPLDPPYCREDDICDVFTQTYLSNNFYMGDSIPPTGELNGVDNGQRITTGAITLSGWGYDSQTGLDYGQLKAYFDGGWHNLGPQFNPDFSYTWNLCDAALPVENGVVSVALLLYDLAGNPAPLVGLRHFIKDYACPVPPTTCIPAQNQVALFEDPYFQGGCVKFNIGNYPTANSLNPLGNDDAESMLVGSSVIASLYSEENYLGHSQGVASDIAFMKYRWVDADTLSSMKVTSRDTLPPKPILINPIEATTFRQGDVIPFSWMNAGGAVDYKVEVYKGTTLVKTINWQSDPVVFVDSLLQGSYSWRVQARNMKGIGEWSQSSTFTIGSPIVIPPEETLPYSDTMETTQAKWARDGLWTYMTDASKAHSGTHSWWYQNVYGTYDNGDSNMGSLTSPPFPINASNYYLRFYYRYETETQGTKWDQRWVQVSVDGGAFSNLVQLSDDPQIPETSSWLKVKAISLSQYAGHVIRVRFQFSTLDAAANNFSGWGIDDFSISTTSPQTCGDNRQDETPAQAFLLTYDPSITVPGEICPNGDYDYYKFYGSTGDRIVVDIDAMKDSSLLDAYLYLLDSDGQTVLAENDDEIYAQLRDPLLGFTLPKDGIYYLKLRAWKHPLLGGQEYFYTIRLYQDQDDPNGMITWPPSNIYLPDAVMNFTANVSDLINGVNRVEFYWHSAEWLPGEWELLGTDRDGANGWKISFDPAGEPEGNNAALYIKAFDMAGNLTVSGAWNLGIDKTSPVTDMDPLSGTQPSNAFLLKWTGSDNLSGIDYVEIQEKKNNLDWTTLPPIDGIHTRHWVIGDPGNSYAYRMHGVDHSGNSEVYPTAAEASTVVPGADVLCNTLDAYDSSGDDNSPANASLIVADGDNQVHNYCNPLSPDFQGDEDWVKLAVVLDEQYLIRSHANSIQSASIISLYAPDGITLITESIPYQFGDSTYLLWNSDLEGIVYLRFRHLDGRVIGTEVSSTITVSTGTLNYLPFIKR